MRLLRVAFGCAAILPFSKNRKQAIIFCLVSKYLETETMIVDVVVVVVVGWWPERQHAGNGSNCGGMAVVLLVGR